MNILFVMEHRVNAGNTHAIENYIRVGNELGHQMAFFGESRSNMPGASFSTDVTAFDRVVYLFESVLYRCKALQEATLLSHFPRCQRYVLDADGKFNSLTIVNGYDRNYRDEAERQEWMEFYDSLSDCILKPTIAVADQPRVIALPFFGFNPSAVIDLGAIPRKKYDVLHVGHNWWRWKQIKEQILPALDQIREEIGDIGFIGMWWDAVPEWADKLGLEPAFRVETESFRRLGIHTPGPVDYNDVIQTMSMGRVNIFTQRPYLAKIQHLTLRYFEEFCADTIPLLMLDSSLAEAVYGPAARELTLPGRVAEKILDALRRPDHYREVVADVRRHLLIHHSFKQRVNELVQTLQL